MKRKRNLISDGLRSSARILVKHGKLHHGNVRQAQQEPLLAHAPLADFLPSCAFSAGDFQHEPTQVDACEHLAAQKLRLSFGPVPMNVVHRFILLFFLIPSSAALADAATQRAALADIDRDVWSAFIDGVATFDHARYNGTRSRELVFIDGRRLFNYEEYADDAALSMAPLQTAGSRVDMEVRFLERTTDGTKARDLGLLRSTLVAADGTQLGQGYAHFDAILRLEPEGWRTLTERRWRTGDAAADAAAFAAAHPRGDYAPFLASKAPPTSPAKK